MMNWERHLFRIFRCSYIQARAVKKLSYVAWDLGADGADAAAIDASRR